MAGESPDRSKQRESSAEATSGSAVPVPESRPEPEDTSGAGTGAARDPRLAMAREDAAGPRGGVDTATRVLSRQDLEAARTEPAGPSEPAGPAEGGTGAGSGAAAETAAEAGAAAQGAAGADAEESATGGPDAREDAGADTDTDTDASADTDARPGTAVRAEAAARGADAKAEDAEDAAEDADAKAREAKAAVARTADADAEDTSVPAPSALAAPDADEVGAAGSEPEDAVADESADEGAAAADRAEDAEDAGSPAEDPQDGTRAPQAADADRDAERPAEDPQDDVQAPEAADAEQHAAQDTDTDDTDDADAAPEGTDADATAGPDPADEPTGAGTDSATDAEAGSGDGGGGDRDDKKPDGPGKPVVDQPTAVFRTAPPAAPTADQPTTMLKAPRPDAPPADAPRPDDSRSDDSPPGDSRPEAPAERTSKFVALKPDLPQDPPGDPRAARAPQPATPPDVTTAVPQVGPERTTQQPLPPKPPLDLLAELTNTPPPPETPVRTLVRRVKIWTPLVLLLAVVFAIAQSVRPLPAPTLDLTAGETYRFGGGRADIPWPAAGQAALDVDGIGTFGSSGERKPVPIASVAKVMTAYVVLRDRPLKSGAEGPKIKIDRAAEDQSDAGQESTVKVTEGDSISQREALESILIASANNVARLLARWNAGSEKAFVAKMNAAADDLGMTDTKYTDPSGLNDTTVSTAVDQVKLARAAMKEPAFREVAGMMSYDDYKGLNHSNWNQLVGRNGVVGIKTGTTTSALGNLVFAAKKEIGGETRMIVGAVVRQPAGGPENTILSAALSGGDRLIRAAQGALKTATILKKGDVVGSVDDGLGGRTPVVVTKDVTAVGWSGLKVRLTFASDEVPRTAKAGTKVGTLTVGDGSSGAVKVPVALKDDLVEPGFSDKLTRLG
ncbi:D-alanyl-D-alanine carboxypeptidase [Streptomyces zinciresistens K42]|uniref:serine-type D-Ala-D-Ala carboxypeptidase n=1 Tax=Streptomyces zinciresistens K42 TaxID=700597 RepID=G2G7P3_9ACTN|nr:D-alanyl-D-alanine carboxypeptidase [Streptomyces zinciresistens]EGX60469.1 D-alanyl-D-alanine carboxypeptidase [Streptomyces zinciresistens K42]